MHIDFIKTGNGTIARAIANNVIIHNAQEALELLMNCSYQGAYKLIVEEEHLIPAFFDLRTGIAGDILQKFSQYKVQLAIVGDFDKYDSKSLRDFIYESNKVGHIRFVGSEEEAVKVLA